MRLFLLGYFLAAEILSEPDFVVKIFLFFLFEILEKNIIALVLVISQDRLNKKRKRSSDISSNFCHSFTLLVRISLFTLFVLIPFFDILLLPLSVCFIPCVLLSFHVFACLSVLSL